jgi:hypothetical protein
MHKLAPEAQELALAYCDGVTRAFEERPPWELR